MGCSSGSDDSDKNTQTTTTSSVAGTQPGSAASEIPSESSSLVPQPTKPGPAIVGPAEPPSNPPGPKSSSGSGVSTLPAPTPIGAGGSGGGAPTDGPSPTPEPSSPSPTATISGPGPSPTSPNVPEGTGGMLGDGGSSGTGGSGTGGSSADAGVVADDCPAAEPLTGGMQYCMNSRGDSNGGYSYELWSSGVGTGCMTVYGQGAAFGATWTDVDDFLARIGLQFDQSKTPQQIGTLAADFAETKTSEGGLTYVGIYGWTVDPLREYYILDDWGDSKPSDTASDGTPRTKVGTLETDGDTYDVWKHTQTNKPAITGDGKTFDQYFSVRRNPRHCGHISISTHFNEWMRLGLDLGKLEEAKLLLEAQSNSGTIEFSTATVTLK